MGKQNGGDESVETQREIIETTNMCQLVRENHLEIVWPQLVGHFGSGMNLDSETGSLLRLV
jgi:hypothetical protein